MAEQIDLAAASGPQTTLWRVKALTLSRGYTAALAPDPASSFITVTLIGQNGRTLSHEWLGAPADADIVALNKVRLDTISLNRRILNKLVADGVQLGTISGTPD